jgi:hypothetical protein
LASTPISAVERVEANPTVEGWHYSIAVADLARFDDFAARLPTPRLRDAATTIINEGLRRRYRTAQIACGVRLEDYGGLLGLLLDEVTNARQ